MNELSYKYHVLNVIFEFKINCKVFFNNFDKTFCCKYITLKNKKNVFKFRVLLII